MGSSTILRKLLLSALLLILVALGSAAVFLSRYTAASELQHAEDMMAAQARILAPSLAAIDAQSLADWTNRAGAQSNARVTVIGGDGKVLADSQHDPSTMDNHAGRPEVRQAFAGTTGTSVRHSATLDADLCYLAIPATLQGKPAVILRLAVPLRQIDLAMAAVRWVVLRASLVAAAFALGVAFFVSRAFSRRIHRIQTFAHDLVNEEYSGTLASDSDDELGSVARSLRSMAEQFRRMLRTQSDESARRKALLAGMVEGVLAVDPDLRVTFCNSSFARALKCREPLPEHTPVVEVVRDPALLDLLRQVIATGEPSRRRLTLTAAEGRIFDVQGAPVGSKPAVGAIAVLHDVTDVEHLERVRKDFVANISHELRTPLAAIRGYAETLLDGAMEDQANSRKFLEIICRNTVRLGDMAADLLALSELETEQESPPAEKVSVRDVAAAALRAVERETVSRNVDVFAGAIEDVHINGQRFRLEHILSNLLANAIRFNRPGGEVRLEAVRAGEEVRITVSDTGTGIPFQDLPRIFERFYCVDKARSRETGGTGLGLSIVKHMTEKMGGTVSVESSLGKGSIFRLHFRAS
jgi:two-component system, OmpR family, phosphate regulon sensor histidine kinase PhoR